MKYVLYCILLLFLASFSLDDSRSWLKLETQYNTSLVQHHDRMFSFYNVS